MIGLLQRVSHAQVKVDQEVVGRIGPGLLVLVGVEQSDTEADAQRLLQRLLGYRVFADQQGKMNLSLTQTGGGLLLVSQFTLVADTRKGARPSFSSAAPPALGQRLFEHLVNLAKDQHVEVESGRFGADMQVELLNDGPVTFWLTT